MKYITNNGYVLTRLPEVVPEVSYPNVECPNPQAWAMYDGMATEVETLQFLYALVRLLKPKVCVETGTYFGYGTAHIAQALIDNDQDGVIYTAETDSEVGHKAYSFLTNWFGTDRVKAQPVIGRNLILSISTPIDMAFLDSNLETRMGELEVLYPRLRVGGMVAVHDTSTFHDAHCHLRTVISNFASTNSMQVVNLDAPRGLTLLKKI